MAIDLLSLRAVIDESIPFLRALCMQIAKLRKV
jgi:hypothetical protein